MGRKISSPTPAFTAIALRRFLLTGAVGLCSLVIPGVAEGQPNTFPPSGNVGIGTTSPGKKLTISGGQIGIDNATGILAKDTTGTYQNLANANNDNSVSFGSGQGGWTALRFFPGAAEAMRITNSGNVGIGTTSPQSKLSVAGGAINVTDTYAQTYPLVLQNSAQKADTGNYVGLLLQTADSTNSLTGSLLLNTDPTGSNRYLRVGAWENGFGWRSTALYGNIGIGVTTPPTRLANTTTSLDDGARGISSAGLTWSQTASGDTGYTAGFVNPQTPGGGNTAHGVFIKIADTNAPSNILSLLSGSNVSRFVVKGNGAIGMGTASPCTASNAPSNCLLSVNGAVQAKEVVVNTGWSDYVFDANYELAPLKDVAVFVKENHHLPGIPSAAEVAEKGVSIGEMQAKLLAKIEELTLHVIRLDETNRELRREINVLKADK